MFVGACALPFLRCRLLQRFERPLDGDRFGEREILPVGVLCELAAHHGVEINYVDCNLGPAEQLGGMESALTGNEGAIRPDNNAMQQPETIENLRKQNFNVVVSKSLTDAQTWLDDEMKHWESITNTVKIEAPN